MSRRWLPLACLLASSTLPAADTVPVSEGTNISADANPVGGRIAMSLLDSLWLLPARGGEASRLVSPILQADRPRWSPDGRLLLYESRQGGRPGLRLHDPGDGSDGSDRALTPPERAEQYAAWHPSGERIIYASHGNGSGVDLWERDLATGLAWRSSFHHGDESWPAWSADGRHLAYVVASDDRWQLLLRRFGRKPVVLVESSLPLYAPSWRPDNTLLTFLATREDGTLSLEMLILSAPPLQRTLAAGEDFFLAPVDWLDRQRFLYTADGHLKSRHFEARAAREIPFRAVIAPPREQRRPPARRDPLADVDDAAGRFVLRVARLFDGNGDRYRHDVDIVIDAGRVTAVEEQRERPDETVIDIGTVTAMPGLIDVWGGFPAGPPRAAGARLLAFGVTTLVTPDAPAARLPKPWQDQPGPRLLLAISPAKRPGETRGIALVTTVGNDSPDRRQQDRLGEWQQDGVPLLAPNWRSGLATGADLILGSSELPVSPQGRRYADLETLMRGGALTLVSALADAATPGVADLYRLPPAAGLSRNDVSRRFTTRPVLGNGRTRIVLGSRPSALPPGLAAQAELRAMAAAGMPPARVLQAGTADAAAALGLGAELGRIAPGFRADLLLIAGDPLARPAEAAEIVAVVRGGRFFSVAGLLDPGPAAVD